jgi:hypothetical protein
MAKEHPKTHSYCNGIIETGKCVIFNMPSGNEKLFHLVPSLENVDLGKVGSFQVKLIYIRKTFWRLFRNP